MNAKVRPQHSKRTHALFGVGAATLGILLGFVVVYLDGSTQAKWIPQAQAGNEECVGTEEQYTCPIGTTKQVGTRTIVCMRGKTCTEQGGRVGGECKKAGKCEGKTSDGKALEGKPKEMPKEMGGMPPMLPMLPMPMPKMPMPMEPKPADCEKHPTSTDCRSTSGSSGISGFLGNLFGTNSESGSTIGNAVQSTFQSVTDRLTSFLKGGTESSATVNANTGTATNNPTEAVVTPVTPSGSNAGQLTAQGTVQASSNGTTQGNGLSAPTVTGFEGGASADVNTSTGPIVTAIRDVIGKIRDLLSSWF